MLFISSSVFAQKWDKTQPKVLFAEDKNKNVDSVLVGIGTATPTEQLTVAKNIRSYKNILADSTLTANLILTNAARVYGLAEIDNLIVNGFSTLKGILTLGNNFTLDGNNSTFTVATGFINFGNTSFTDVNTIVADSISANYLSASGIQATAVGASHLSADSANLNNITSSSIQTSYISADSASLKYITSQAIQSPLISSSSYLLNGTPLQPSQWLNNGSGSILYTGNAAVNGTFQATEINTANITISDKFTAVRGEFDTLKTERFEAVKMIETDTLHAMMSVLVNNSLRIRKATLANYAEVTTKDTLVALVLQREAAGQVMIGRDSLISTLPGQEKDKLTVVGNVRFVGDANVSGSVSADCVSTSCLKVSGLTTFDSLNVTNRIKVGTSSLFVGGAGPGNPIGGLNNNIFSTSGPLTLQNGSAENTLINPTGGNLGVGTTTPSQKFEVNGVTEINTFGKFGNNGGYSEIGYNGAHSIINTSGDLLINWYSGKDVIIGGGNNGLSTGNLSAMHSATFATVNGAVGIGTTTPSKKLEVAHDDGVGTSDGIALKNLSAANKNSEIKFYQGSTALWAIGNDVTHNGGQNFFIYDNTVNSGVGATRFYIDAGGRVGINTVPPTTSSFYKLFVDGGIAARDVKVTANATFPDYVFEPDYKLMSLYELEKYLILKKRLPGMPSAKEVEKNEGFELGDMQIKLLQKLEEQTLYIIDLQKQMDELKKQVVNIKK